MAISFRDCFSSDTRAASSIVFIVGVVLFIILSITVVAPNFHGLKFEEGTCQIEYAKTMGDVSCDCGDDDTSCTSYYPCMEVFVSTCVTSYKTVKI